MHLRLAKMDDLPQLKVVYREIINNMNNENIEIWDDIYPCEFFYNDIENNSLYVLVENDEIVAAFVKWKNEHHKALYIDRFGVNVNYLRKGIGSIMLNKAISLAKEKGAESLRLFVVDINEPAINL